MGAVEALAIRPARPGPAWPGRALRHAPAGQRRPRPHRLLPRAARGTGTATVGGLLLPPVAAAARAADPGQPRAVRPFARPGAVRRLRRHARPDRLGDR